MHSKTGKRFNLGDGSNLQIPCILKIIGSRNFISIQKKQFDILKKNFNSDFAFIFLLKLSEEYWSKRLVSWFNLVNVQVIEGSSYQVILRGMQKQFKLLEVRYNIIYNI